MLDTDETINEFETIEVFIVSSPVTSWVGFYFSAVRASFSASGNLHFGVIGFEFLGRTVSFLLRRNLIMCNCYGLFKVGLVDG